MTLFGVQVTPLICALVVCTLIALILIAIEVGYRVGVRRWAGVDKSARLLNSTMEASVFGLMGLLVAFIFYGAGARFDARRALTVQEANAIGTAYLRIDLLPSETQPQLREEFREYLRSRIAVFQKVPEFHAMQTELVRSSALQSNIWTHAVSAATRSGPATQTLVLSAINEVIDITTAQNIAMITHPPAAVCVMLLATLLVASALAGYSMAALGAHDWIAIVVYAFVLSIAVYVIFDYEYPRIGLIRVDSVDQALFDTLARMK